MRKRECKRLPKREGNGVSPLQDMDSATSKPPGMTGTGAPVTEQLRYCVSSELGWYRDAELRPYARAEFIFL